jgi:hypothetical protein
VLKPAGKDFVVLARIRRADWPRLLEAAMKKK